MADEVETALAFVARREGRRSMPASRWAHIVSLDLGWMPPAQAKAFVARGVAAALLRVDGEDLRLAIDPATVEVPRGFKPGPQDAIPEHRPTAPRQPDAPPAEAAVPMVDPFLDWVDRLATHNRVERRQVLDQVAGVQDGMGGSLSAMAALLWLAARAGLDVKGAAALVKP